VPGSGGGQRLGLPAGLAGDRGRLGSEWAVTTTLLKGPYLDEAGIQRGLLWAHTVTLSEEAQDDGVVTDEAGVKAWLAENQSALTAEATPGTRWRRPNG
jgi:hypothetical protein